MTQPLSPSDLDREAILTPEEVKVVNQLMFNAGWNGFSICIYEADLRTELQKIGSTRPLLSHAVRRVYEAAGWDVEYDSPGYGESYRAHFIFKKPKR